MNVISNFLNRATKFVVENIFINENQEPYRKTLTPQVESLIDMLAPKLTDSVFEKIKAKYPLPDSTRGDVEHAVTLVALKVASNFAKDGAREPLQLLSKIAEIARGENAVDEFLRIGLPNGLEDIPVKTDMIKELVYKEVQDTLAGYFNALQPEESNFAVFRGEGGEALFDLMKLFMAKALPFAKETAGEHADKIIDHFLPGEANPVKERLVDDLRALLKSDDPNFSFFDQKVESAAVRILTNLERTSPYRDEKNAATRVIKNLVDIARPFLTENGLSKGFVQELLQRTGLQDDPLLSKIKVEDLTFFENVEAKPGADLLAKDIREVVLDYVKSNPEYLAKALSELLGHQETTKSGEELREALSSIMNSDERLMDFAEGLFAKALTRILSGDTANGLRRVSSLIFRNLERLNRGVNEIMKSDIADKEQAVNELFAPIAAEIVNVADLNVPPFVLSIIEKTLLPKLLSKFFLDMTAVHREGNEEELAKMFKKAPLGIAKITDYIGKYVPHYLKKNADKIAKMVVEKGSQYFEFLDGHEISHKIKESSKSPELNPIWKAVASYAQGFFTKAFLGAARNLEKAESAGKSADTNPLLINLLMSIMGSAEGHFRRIANLQAKSETMKAFNLSHEDLLREFAKGAALHPALLQDLNVNATDEEKKQARLEAFFKPLAKEIIKLAGEENFSIPEAFNKSGMKVFEEEVLPEILMEIYSDILQPHNVNKIMTSMVDKLDKIFDTLTDDIVNAGEIDATQSDLNNQIGNLIKSFVSIMPESLSNLFFSCKEIKEMSAEKIGNIIRMKTNATTLLDVVNALFKDIELEAPDVNDRRTKEEKEKAYAADSKKLQSKVTQFVSKQAKRTAKEFIKEKWDTFQKNFDDWIAKHLGAPGIAVKKFLDMVFGTAMRIVLPVIEFVLFNMVWKIVDLHIWRKSGELINDAKMPIHENALFSLTEISLQAIKQELERVKQDKAERDAERIEGERLKARTLV